MKKKDELMIPEEIIMSRIYLVRGKKVMLDMDLAGLYGVETKQLKRAVKRNTHRFPPDFMFGLSRDEFDNLRSQIGTSSSSWGGTRYLPMAFTEQGVAMLSSVLNSEKAILVNIHIIRIFSKMREMIMAHKDVLEKLDQLEERLDDQDEKVLLIFEYLKQMEQTRQQQEKQAERKLIGFKREGGGS
jgi:hypothetical protein